MNSFLNSWKRTLDSPMKLCDGTVLKGDDKNVTTKGPGLFMSYNYQKLPRGAKGNHATEAQRNWGIQQHKLMCCLSPVPYSVLWIRREGQIQESSAHPPSNKVSCNPGWPWAPTSTIKYRHVPPHLTWKSASTFCSPNTLQAQKYFPKGPGGHFSLQTSGGLRWRALSTNITHWDWCPFINHVCSFHW